LQLYFSKTYQMQENKNLRQEPGGRNTDPVKGTEKQEQGDPQLTELRGFVDPREDLEPTLTDGTKAPDKAEEENARNGARQD
jgi:hypothetical protein